MGKNHARVLSSMNSVEKLFLYDPLGSSAGDFSGAPVFQDLEIFLSQMLDYCVVSCPTKYHKQIALELALRGIPALIEKPLALNVDEALEIQRAFDEKRLLASVGHIERFNPAIAALKDKVRGGLLGHIFQISTRRVGPYSGRIKDVGVVLDLASHDIDLVSWVTNSKYDVVHSNTFKPVGTAHEDALLSIGVLTDGTGFSHTVNWISPTKERVTSIVGERGILIADSLNIKLTYFENSEPWFPGSAGTQGQGMNGVSVSFELDAIEPLVAEHIGFQNALLSENLEGIIPLIQGVEVLRVAERMLASA